MAGPAHTRDFLLVVQYVHTLVCACVCQLSASLGKAIGGVAAYLLLIDDDGEGERKREKWTAELLTVAYCYRYFVREREREREADPRGLRGEK